MRFFVIAVLMLVLSSCYTQNYRATTDFRMELKEVDYFDEWGLFKFTGQNVLSNASGDVSAEDIAPEKLCKFFLGGISFYGARLYLNDSTESVSLECLFMLTPVKSQLSNGMWLDRMLFQNYIWVENDSLYYILYGGNEMRLQSGADIHHRLVCQEERIDSCPLDKKFEKERDNIYFKGPFYELSIPANRPFISITKLTDPKDLEGYKPLKLDPSILPLESPGYKKLREQEEALGRK